MRVVKTLCSFMFAGILPFQVAGGDESSQCLDGGCVRGASLMQKTAASSKTSENSVPFIQMDGVNKIDAPRRVFGKGFTRELLIRYPVSSNAIEFQENNKVARIDFSKKLQGRFSRVAFPHPEAAGSTSDDTIEQRDYGVQVARAMNSGPGSISAKVNFGFSEKSHTFWMPEGTSRATETKLNQAKNDQTDEVKQSAKFAMPQRNGVVSAFLYEIFGQLGAASRDPQHTDALRQYSQKSGGSAEQSLLDALDHANQQYNQQREAFSKQLKKKPIRSSIGCLHFELDDTAVNNERALVPLDTKIVAWRGRAASSPNSEYQLSSGIAVFRRDGSDLVLYIAFSSTLDLVDTDQGFKALFTVGPADGLETTSVGEDGRSIAPPASPKAGFLWNTYAKQMPLWFDYAHSSRQEAGCSDAMLGWMAATLPKLRQKVKMGVQLDSAETQIMGQIYSLGGLCAAEYLKPSHDEAIVVYDRIEGVAIIHALMELAQPELWTTFNTHTLWNTFSIEP